MKKTIITILLLFIPVFALICTPIIISRARNDGWRYNNGWYYLYSDGAYARSEYINGYWIDASGWYDPAWDGKWKRDNTGWWFSSGAWYPTSQWLKIDGEWYYFKEDGYMAHGEWVEDYYLTESGAMATGDDVPEKVSTRWTVTSYSSATGGQTMRYTIVDEFDRLMIIDGGWEEDASSLKDIIAEHDNHVYAWIVTHPHFDHAGAFNVIMSENNDIMVDDVYVTNLDYDRYKETAQSYDHFETCEKYKDVINGLDNVTVLKEGDVVSKRNIHASIKRLYESGWVENCDWSFRKTGDETFDLHLTLDVCPKVSGFYFEGVKFFKDKELIAEMKSRVHQPLNEQLWIQLGEVKLQQGMMI